MSSIDLANIFTKDFASKLTQLQQFSGEILDIKRKANEDYLEQNYRQAEIEYKKVLDTFQSFTDKFGITQQPDDEQDAHDQQIQDQDQDQIAQPNTQGEQGAQQLINQTNIYQIYQECHLNLSLCQLKQKKYTNAIETLTVILKYDDQNAKVLYLRGKALVILKNYSHALNDLCKAKTVSRGSYPEIDTLIAEVRKQIKRQSDENQNKAQENFQSFDISRARQSKLVSKMSHASLLGNNTQPHFEGTANIKGKYDPNQLERRDTDFKIHTRRGGQIQNRQLNHEIEDIINLKKPRKLKLVKILFTILRHFFSSMYFFFILLFVYFLKIWYAKIKQARFEPQDIKVLSRKFM